MRSFLRLLLVSGAVFAGAHMLLPAKSQNWPVSGALAKNITTSTNTQVKTGAGIFFGLSVNTGQSGDTVTVYDGTDNTGTKIGTYSSAAVGSVQYPIGIQFVVGLFVVTAGGTPADVTVVYY